MNTRQIVCYTRREVVNASRRIGTESLRGYSIEPGPCGGCFSGKKATKLVFGSQCGEIVRAVMYGAPDDPLLCMEDAIRKAKENEPELTGEEFEARLKLFTGKGTHGIYRYLPPNRRRKRVAVTEGQTQ